MTTPRMKKPVSGLYAVTPDLSDTKQLIEVTRAALIGGVRVLQYRNKSAEDALRLVQARQLAHLCKAHDTALIINDHIDLALAVDADGVHVGMDDVTASVARHELGADKIVGVSCYDQVALAQRAVRHGA